MKELLDGIEAPKSIEEAVNTYLSAAKKLGIELNTDDLLGAIKEAGKGQEAQTAEAEAAVQNVNMEDLEKTAGGACTDPAYTAGNALEEKGKKVLKDVCSAIFW